MDGVLATAIERALGARVTSARPISEGHGARAWYVRLRDERELFVKTGSGPDALSAEARGLAWLGEARAIRTPDVVLVLASPGALVLEWIASGKWTNETAVSLGVGLAALHRAGAPSFGLDHDNWLASIPQSNGARDDWATFYGEQRLLPLLARAVDLHVATDDLRRRVESVVRTLPERVGPPEPPARLHGDLWRGNVLGTTSGEPVLIDPAVYGGHREIDLAMMRLFGGFGPATFAAYEATCPLAPGHAERVPLYQLLPLLAHLVLFGASYASGVEAALRDLGA